jgi:hypothetical protein
MRIPRSRGAVSGLLLMILGAWGALIPFIGPYFDVSMGTDETWNWTSGRLWLSVIPGVVAFLGGFLTLTSAHRAKAGFGAWMAIAAGAWFVVGPTVSMLWNDGASAAGTALGGTNQRVLTLLVSFDALGVAIAILGAFALGRLAVRSVRDVELAREDERARERDRLAREQRFDREPAATGAGTVDRADDRTVVADRADDRTAVAGRADDRTEVVDRGADRTEVVDRAGDRPAVAQPDPQAPEQRTGAVAASDDAEGSGGVMGRLRRS